MKKFSYLDAWLNGHEMIPHYDDLIKSEPDYCTGFWINVVDEIPLHKINDEKILGFADSFDKNRTYYYKAIKIAHRYESTSLDHEDIYNIREALGDAPNISYPIYIICIKKDENREIVYIGKSSSNISRFRGGHNTAIKLLDPKFDGYEKTIILCNIILYTTNDYYLPLEFIKEKKLGLEILEDIESRMIDEFKPQLNSQKMNGIKTKHEFDLRIENHENGFLHEKEL
ncbi:hypothetical protein [Halpernia frigidisoli]|uniref:GIY-YIG domain-containing protein n=1 Tax=Halpernia frigidisoli TaxID=1125876 RepID=A0A1I3CRB2_9FLAO|nr:hypothetical protein [Halpernia frigidisoli]SFH76888.1 hypothetical protein SAMN05443292_0021 [Halpernia frigidisoli]